MATDSMGSMTPPVSPSHLDFPDSPSFQLMEDLELAPQQEIEETVQCGPSLTAACFHCKGEVFPSSGQRLYHQDPPQSVTHNRNLLNAVPLPLEQYVDLFGYRFPLSAFSERMDMLFRLARQTLSDLHSASDKDSTFLMSKRQEIVAFLEYIRGFIMSPYLPENENVRRQFLRSLVQQLQLLLIFSGRITDQASVSVYSPNQQLSAVHHRFHACLEVCWCVLTLFHTLNTIPQGTGVALDFKLCRLASEQEEMRSPFDQLLNILFHDLITLAVPVFEKLPPQDWLHGSPFSCSCVKELWTRLIHLLHHRTDSYHTESFWVQLFRVLQRLGENTVDLAPEEEIDCNVFELTLPSPGKPLGFTLWLLTHLNHLTGSQDSENSSARDTNGSGFFAIQLTMDKMMKGPVKEDILRACLRCCLAVASLWPPPSQLLTMLWEFFAKKLDDRFQLVSTSIEGLAIISKSSRSLLERCMKFCSDEDLSHGLDHDTSFHLFLRLLARLLRKNPVNEWRQIKGRFFSKFHQRRLQDLSETGLHNMTCLFLTVASCVDSEEVARKLLGMYDLVDPTSAFQRLRLQVWCGALAATQLLIGRGATFTFLAEKLASSFNHVAKQFSGSLMDFSTKQELSSLISLYVESVRDIAEHSQLTSHEYLFIDSGLSQVLRAGSEAQIRHILTVLDSVISRLRFLLNEAKQSQSTSKEALVSSHRAFADRLWLHVFPFVRDHALTLTPPLSLADLAVSFSHLALDLPAPVAVCPEGLVGVVHCFIAEHSHPSIVCHYLNQLFGDAALLRAAMKDEETASGLSASSVSLCSGPGSKKAAVLTLSQTDVVKCWWKCVLLLPSSSASLGELTQHLWSLPDVSALCCPALRDDGLMTDVRSWKELLETFAARFSQAQSLLEKQKLRGQVMAYFMDTAHQVAPVLRTGGPLEAVVKVYRAAGHLVKLCAPLLYLQSKPCPLPEVIKSMVLPAAVFNADRPLGSNVAAALKETLHLFLEGLGRLDYSRDSYVQRQIGSIVSQYLPRFPLNLLDVYSHPVLKLLGKLPHERTEGDVPFHRFLSETIVENLRKMNSPVSSQVVTLLKTRS